MNTTQDTKRQAVLDAINAALEAGEQVTVAAIARGAQVDRTWIYRQADIRTRIELAEQDRERNHGPIMGDADKRLVSVTFRMSANVTALIRQHGGGLSEGQYAWAATLEKLARDLGVDVDDVDPVKRTRRRANRSKR